VQLDKSRVEKEFTTLNAVSPKVGHLFTETTTSPTVGPRDAAATRKSVLS